MNLEGTEKMGLHQKSGARILMEKFQEDRFFTPGYILTSWSSRCLSYLH